MSDCSASDEASIKESPLTKLVLAFDIGTMYSGVSYSILEDGKSPQVHELARFPGQQEGTLRVPSVLYYDYDGKFRAAGGGLLADYFRQRVSKEGRKRAKWWKLHLRPQHLNSSTEHDNYIPPLPPGKTVVDVLTDFIKYLFKCARNYIKDRHSGLKWPAIEDSIEFIFTHPNGWEGVQRQQYRRAIENAGLVPDTPEGQSRVRLITECEASLHFYVSNLLERSSTTSPQHVVVIDAGGGTIDLSMYSVAHNSISCQEIAPAECRLEGSVFVKHCTVPFVQSSPPPKSSRVPTDAFDAITEAIKQQKQAAARTIHVAFLVGGFSMNQWLQTRLQSYFEDEGIKLYYSADHAHKAVANGAVLSHIERSPSQPLVTLRVSRATSRLIRSAFPSAARDRWEDQKQSAGAQNAAIDKIMEMIGLEHVKEQILNIKGIIDTAKRQGVPISKERLNIQLVGNPGTGKTTVARLYGEFLKTIGAIPGDAFLETTGSRLSFEGMVGAKTLIDGALAEGGGTIFIDEAYQLASEHDRSGKQVLDFLLDEMEKNIGKLAFVLAGQGDSMAKFFEQNPGLSTRFPYKLRFPDYTHQEFMLMLENMVNKRHNGWVEVEGNIDGLYARIAIRRLVRGSGTQGFGNVRALGNMFSKIRERQAVRLERERKLRIQVDDFLFTKEDLIGPDPSKVLHESAPRKKLQEMIGLESVKASVRNMFKLLETNYSRELAEKEPMQVSLNRVFLGSPGTGKTSVAKLYGQILADLGMLSKGEVVVKNPSDFVSDHLGGSEKNTKAILESTRGKVLLIDEAYMLYNKGATNSYNTSVVDTMVAEIQSIPGEDRCVLLLGYRDQMEEMFKNVNSGLARRFAIENAFNFEDFTEPQLMQILDLKLREQDLHASEEAKRVAGEVLNRLKVRPNFGNAGEIDNMLGQAKARYQERVSSIPAEQRMDVTFEPQDIDPEFARNQVASENLDRIFADVVGCIEIKERLDGYQKVALEMRENGMDMHDMREIIPTSFIFKGPPGTGKTTIARKFGQIFYDMGFLGSAEVVECSATDLTGQYVGHTGPKTKGIFEKALGKVLFIDEAYRLSDGHYAKEATEEIVGLMTNERFMNNLVVILAGYEKEMNTLLATNPGLSSRFSEEIIFPNLSSAHCLELLDQELRKKKIELPELKEKYSDSYVKMQGIIDHLSMLPSWGNARDVKTLGQKMVRQAYMARRKKLSLSVQEASDILEGVLKMQHARQSSALATPSRPATNDPLLPQYSPPRQASPPPVVTVTESSVKNHTQQDSQPPEAWVTTVEDEDESPRLDAVQRDPGVSDAVWKQLQADIERQKSKKQEAKEKKMQQMLKNLGRCPMDYEWIRQDDGYRCAGGTHFMSHDELARAAKRR